MRSVPSAAAAVLVVGLTVGVPLAVATAQDATVEVEPVDVQEVPDDAAPPREQAPQFDAAPDAAAEAATATEADAPGQDLAAVTEPAVASPGNRRLIVDTGVSNVQVSDVLTVAIMNQSTLSTCPSNEYVFERDRPKWLFQTGRLLQAMKEGATVRVSFTCVEGRQSISALQFLSPAGAQPDAMPRRGQLLESAAANRPRQPVPVPTSAVPVQR